MTAILFATMLVVSALASQPSAPWWANGLIGFGVGTIFAILNNIAKESR